MPSSPADAPAAAGEHPDTLDRARILTDEAEALLADGRFEDAVKRATRATAEGGDLARTWRILAKAFAGLKDLPSAFGAYGQALATASDPTEIQRDMGLLALRLGLFDRAELLLGQHLERAAPTVETVSALARAQTKLLAFDRAHATLKAALESAPGEPRLWLALAQLLCVEGRHAQAGVFFEEALRLDPTSAAARDGLADALLVGGADVEAALAAGEAAVAAAGPEERPQVVAAQARRLLAAGRLAQGWSGFAAAAEVDGPGAAEPRVAAPRWTGGARPPGSLLLLGEDSLVDELLLAAMVPDLLAQGLSPIVAVDPCWERLARRSLAPAQVTPRLTRTVRGRRLVAAELDSPHIHGGALIGGWTHLRALAPLCFARWPDDANARPYLRPDPDRVEHWRERLGAVGPGPKVGVAWRALVSDGAQEWETPPLAALARALSIPGLQLISLQRAPAAGELEWIADVHGLQIHPQPPEFRPEDLDDTAALACALDLVVGPPDAATIVAAASGAPTWLLSTPRHWAMLGTDGWPWFPAARTFCAAAPNDWTRAMAALAQSLAELV